MASASPDHAALMDRIYRGQRHIYDATRKYFLFGRDTLIAGLKCQRGHTVLELGCGTGRNLAKIGDRWPGAILHGLDISNEMLKNANAVIGDRAVLARGDATLFDPEALFGRSGFDRVVLSFAVSMIPDWTATIEQALATLTPRGSLHIVDFGDLAGIPRPARTALQAWLTRFHVTPRQELFEVAAELASARGLTCATQRGAFGYYRLIVVGGRAD